MKALRHYLRDMLEYIGYLEQFAAEGQDSLHDIKTQLAVRKAYEVLGEIAKRLPDSLLERQSHIPWRSLKGMRDILSHRYDDIDLDLVWDAMQSLTALRVAVQSLLDFVNENDQDD